MIYDNIKFTKISYLHQLEISHHPRYIGDHQQRAHQGVAAPAFCFSNPVGSPVSWWRWFFNVGDQNHTLWKEGDPNIKSHLPAKQLETLSDNGNYIASKSVNRVGVHWETPPRNDIQNDVSLTKTETQFWRIPVNNPAFNGSNVELPLWLIFQCFPAYARWESIANHLMFEFQGLTKNTEWCFAWPHEPGGINKCLAACMASADETVLTSQSTRVVSQKTSENPGIFV